MPTAPRSIWLGSAAAVALATAAALLVVLTGVVLSGDQGETDARTLGTTVAALLCGGAALAGLALLERGMTLPGAIVLIASGAAFALTTFGLWKFGYDAVGEGETPNDWFKLVPTGFAWSTALLVGASAALLAREARQPATFGAWIAAAAWATAVTGVVWFERYSDHWLKVIAALTVLAIGSFLFAPLAQRAQRPS